MAAYVRVAKLSEVPPGTVKPVEANGVGIALCNVGGTVYALRDECTHEAFPLSAGELEGAVLTCPLHGAQFDVRTGRVRALPATVPVQTYPVRVEGEDIYVAVEP